MQVEDVSDTKVRNHLYGVYSTLRPLQRLLKIFALSADIQCKSHLKYSWSLFNNIITATILGVLSGYTLYYKIEFIYSEINVSIKLTDAIQMIYDYCQYMIDLYFVYKYGRDFVLEYYKQYGNIDQILCVTYYPAIKAHIMKLIGLFLLIWMASSACDFIAWFLSYGLIIPVIYSVAYIYLLIKTLTTLDLTANVMHIECRLQVIADYIKHYYLVTESLPGSVGDSIVNKNWFHSDTCNKPLKSLARRNSLKTFSTTDCHHEVKGLSRCYLLLLEQCIFINSMYGMRILLNSLSLLIDMVRFTNIAVRMMIGSQQTIYDSGYLPAVSSLMRMFACVAVIISLVQHCEQAYRQSDRIVWMIDHLLINKNPSDAIRVALSELRALVQSRPVRFHMAYFFCLNYSLLVSIASVVVTYTIILLQNVN